MLWKRKYVTRCASSLVFLLVSYSMVMLIKESTNINIFNPKFINSEALYDKWIVVTTVSEPTEQVKCLANISGWRLVAVGDRKSPSHWKPSSSFYYSLSGCDYLSVEAQRNLGFSIVRHLPLDSYTRKIVGYLYAIQNGAQVIYDTDDDNVPLDMLEGFNILPKSSGLMFVESNVFNPYHHFGQSSLWPRGFPLTYIGKKPQRLYRVGNNFDTPIVQQGLVNGDPDMDAIFRLSRKAESVPLNVTFDPSAPAAVLPEGVFSPYNSQNTFFQYPGFWSLFLPTTTTFRMCDIWRGYWAQRLMWEVGGRIAFYPANAFQKRNAHSYLKDAKQEIDMYFQTENLIEFLRNWICEETLRFFPCVIQLTKDMSDNGFWGSEDVQLVRLWLADLTSLGYKEPERVLLDAAFLKSDYNQTQLDDWKPRDVKLMSNVTFTPCEQKPPSVNIQIQNEPPMSLKAKNILIMCGNVSKMFLNTMFFGNLKNESFFSDLLLVIVFNHPHYENIQHLDAIHGAVFSNIVYCGENLSLFTQQTKRVGKSFSFIEALVYRGKMGYVCAVKAMEMGYKVKGYLIAGDDVLFQPHVLLQLDKNHAGLSFTPGGTGWINTSVSVNKWPAWGEDMGREAYMNTLQDIANSTADAPTGTRSLEQFKLTLQTHTNSSELIFITASDFYYIPASLKVEASWFFSKSYNNRLHLEIAVPVVLAGLESYNNMNRFQGTVLWLRERDNVTQYYKRFEHFIHPFKLSSPDVLEFYCQHYFPELIADFVDSSIAQ